jgi:hypothetical protein
VRSAAERDHVSAEVGDVLCFEMEAAGLITNSFSCLVICGNVHKGMLSVILPAEIAKTQTVEEATSGRGNYATISYLFVT